MKTHYHVSRVDDGTFHVHHCLEAHPADYESAQWFVDGTRVFPGLKAAADYADLVNRIESDGADL